MTTLLGKPELLLWASQQTGIIPCNKYDDLKDGLIFLVLAEKIWPNVFDGSFTKLQRHGPRNSRLNWETLKNALEQKGVPTHIVDRKGVAAGHQRPCYNMLVMSFSWETNRVDRVSSISNV